MNRRLAPLAAGLSVLGLLGWLLLRGAGSEHLPFPDRGGISGPAASQASEVPCDAPLRWRVGRVDPEFGIDTQDVRRAAERAAALWEEAADRRLFVRDPDDGFPIRLVYGEGQEQTLERKRRQAELDEERRRIEALRDELGARQAELDAARRAHDERVRDFRRRLARHNDAVRRRNETGGATGRVLDSLRDREEALRRERRSLDRERRTLEERARSLRNEQERLDRRIRLYERRVEELERAFPPGSVEAGRYREVVREEGERTVAVRREIRIHRFSSRDDLVRVLAHEMGHARGLGHTTDPEALMSERYAAGDLDAPPALGPGDVGLLRARCPEDG